MNVCRQCGKRFGSLRGLTQHEATHKKNRDRRMGIHQRRGKSALIERFPAQGNVGSNFCIKLCAPSIIV